MSYRVVFTKQAIKDSKKLKNLPLAARARVIIGVLKKDPWTKNSRNEALQGDLRGAYSRRLNIQHRIVYQVLEKEKTVKVLRMWTHYE